MSLANIAAFRRGVAAAVIGRSRLIAKLQIVQRAVKPGLGIKRAGACEVRRASARNSGPSRGEAPARHGEISEDSRGRRAENVSQLFLGRSQRRRT